MRRADWIARASARRADWIARASARRADWIGPILLAALFAGLTAWSWEKWADVHIDFGAELYTAWRLAEGDALYRDIATRQGPLPPYLNALWFRLFGVSIRTLALCNLAVLAGIAALQWGIFRRACGAWVASAAVAVLLGVFAFGQYVPIGNYNFVTPYHHHQTHGLAADLAMIAAFGAAWRSASASGGVVWHGVAGLCLGAVFLTKAELFAPAAAAAGLGLAVSCRPGQGGRGPRLAAFAAGASLLPAGFFALLAARMPGSQALAGVLGNWSHLGGGPWREPFYRRVAGLDEPGPNVLALFAAASGLAAFAGAVLGADRLLPAGSSRRWLAPAAGLSLLAALSAWPPPWFGVARALPLSTAAILGLLLAELWRSRRDSAVVARRAPLALYALLALGLLAKILLHVRFDHYGFALAMPATLLLVAALLEIGPRVLGPGRGGLARALAAGALGAAVIFFLREADGYYRRKDFAVGEGADRVVAASPYTSTRPKLVAEALARLEALLPPDATLLVLPEGASFNYWLRKRNSTRYLLFLPPEIEAFGEAAMLEQLQASPPDFVALVHRRSDEFGTGPFGADPRNGRRLLAWVEAHYQRVVRIGDEPFGDRFGVVLLRRDREVAP